MLFLSISSKIKYPQNWMDEFCNQCITFLEEMSKILGISYGELNVWLFVIIQPALILFFMFAFIVILKKYNKLKRQIQK